MTADPAARAPSVPLRPALGAALALAGLAVAVVAICFAVQHLYQDEENVLLKAGPGLTIVFALAIWLGRQGAPDLIERGLGAAAGWGRMALFAVCVATLVAALLIARLSLDAFPNSADEYAYIIQAQTYARGALWAPAPPLPQFFEFTQLFAKNGVWISPYQPGWPLLLTPFAAAGLPLWIASPILGAVTATAFFALARQFVERPAAWLALAALVTSPFYLFNYASYFPHGVGALAAVLFAIAGTAYLRGGGWGLALAAGACLGYLGFVRAFNAVLIGAPFAVALLITPNRRLGLVWCALGGAPFLAALLGYFALVTGNPLRPIQEWYHQGAEPIGAPNESSAIESARRLVRLYFWTSPVMLFGWAAAFLLLLRRRAASFVDWIFPVTLIGFGFYGGHGGPQYGPRYLFEAWPFSLLTIARAIEPLLARPRGRAAAWIASALAAHLVFQLAYAVPRLVRHHELTADREAVYQAVAAAGLHDAVVFVRSTSSRRPKIPPSDLTRNGLDPTKPSVVYVLDRGAEDWKVRDLFPGRSFYLFVDGVLRPAPLPPG